MNGPAKNRLHDYEAGWLTLLLSMGVAEERELREAQNRLAQAAIDRMNERRRPFNWGHYCIDKLSFDPLVDSLVLV